MSYQKYNTSQYPRRRGDKYHAPLRYRDQSPPGDAHHAPSWASSDYIAEPVYSDSDDYITPKQQQQQQQQQQPPPPPRQSNLDHYRTAFRRARYEDSSMTSSSSPTQNEEKPCPSSSPYQPGYHPRWPARPRYRSPSPGSDYIAEPVRTEDDYIATPPAKRMPGAFVDEDDTPDFRNGFSDSGLDSSPPQRAVSVPRSISRRRALSKQARVSPERSPSRKRSISRPPPKAEEKPPVPDVPGVPDVTPPSPKPLQRPVSRRRRWDAPASPPRSSSVKDDKPKAPEDTPPSAKLLQRPVSRPKRWDAPVSPRRPSPRRRSPRRRSLKPYELENLREAQEFIERFRAIEKKLSQPEPAESKPAQPKRWDAPASPPRRSPKPHELEHLKEAQEFLRRFRARNRGRNPTPPPPEPPQPQPQAAQPNRWDHAPLPPRCRSLKPHEQENLREAQEFLKRFRAMEKTLSKPKPPQPKALQPEAPQPQPDSPSRWDHAPLPPRRRSLKPHELDNFQEAREFLERFRALDVQHKQRSKSQSSEEYHSEDSDNESGGYHRHASPERRNMRYFPSRQSRRDIYEAGFSHPPTIKRYGPAYSDTASYRSASLSGGASRAGSTARSYISRSPISRRPRLLRVRDRSYDSGRSRSVPARLRIKDGHGSDTDDNGLGEGSDYLPSDESDSGGKTRHRIRRARFSDEEDEDDDYEDEYEHDRRYRHGGGAAARRAYSDDDNGVGEGSDYLSSDDDEEDDYEYDRRRAPVREERRGGGGGGGGFLGYRTTIHRGYRPPEQLRYRY